MHFERSEKGILYTLLIYDGSDKDALGVEWRLAAGVLVEPSGDTKTYRQAVEMKRPLRPQDETAYIRDYGAFNGTP